MNMRRDLERVADKARLDNAHFVIVGPLALVIGDATVLDEHERRSVEAVVSCDVLQRDVTGCAKVHGRESLSVIG